MGATSWETWLVSRAARWPQVADWGRQGDEAGTAEKAPQQHAKDGSMAKLDRWEKAVCRAQSRIRTERVRGIAAGETGRTQAWKSHRGLGKEKPTMTHRLLIWVTAAGGGKDQERRNKPWETDLNSDFHTVSLNFLWAMTLKYNTFNKSQSQDSISVLLNTSPVSP